MKSQPDLLLIPRRLLGAEIAPKPVVVEDLATQEAIGESMGLCCLYCSSLLCLGCGREWRIRDGIFCLFMEDGTSRWVLSVNTKIC